MLFATETFAMVGLHKPTTLILFAAFGKAECALVLYTASRVLTLYRYRGVLIMFPGGQHAHEVCRFLRDEKT